MEHACNSFIQQLYRAINQLTRGGGPRGGNGLGDEAFDAFPAVKELVAKVWFVFCLCHCKEKVLSTLTSYFEAGQPVWMQSVKVQIVSKSLYGRLAWLFIVRTPASEPANKDFCIPFGKGQRMFRTTCAENNESDTHTNLFQSGTSSPTQLDHVSIVLHTHNAAFKY